MSEFRWRAVGALVVSAAMAAWVAGAQAPPGAPGAARPAAPSAPPPAVATVGNLRITVQEFEQRAGAAAAEYKAHSGTDMPAEIAPIVRRQLLESLIRRDLLILEARRRGLLATAQEAEEQLKRDPAFQVGGKFDAARYEQVRSMNPAAVANAIQELRVTLAARKLMEQVQAGRGPDDASLRARVRRELTRATAEYLTLSAGDFDGSYPEPRESEILAAYRARAAEFARPARARLSVVFVDQPALSDSLAALPAAVAAWSAGRKATADSILAAVQGGAKLEDAAISMGGPRPNQIVLPDNFPRYWKGGAETKAALFAAGPGTLLPQAVPAEHGWLVVRVDQVEPAHTAPLHEVAGQVRSSLRAERKAHAVDDDLRALYDALRDSLRTTAYRARVAVADPATLDPGQPKSSELQRFYRAHLADYASFSSRLGGVVARSFEEVRDDVRARWLDERRAALTRDLTRQLYDTWREGKRDAGLEKRLMAREVGPFVADVPADSSEAGRILVDSLSARQGALGAGLAAARQGWVVFDVYQVVPGYLPSLQQVRPRLLERRAARLQQEEEQGARRLFEADPDDFKGGDVLHHARFMLRPQQNITVPLTRAEVERYHREHLDKYSAPEQIRARHILVSPRDNSAAADREARARADSLLEGLRAGEDFASVARQSTDDPATREVGGDLGTFGRGAMLPEFERAVFAMRQGELSRTPVRTPVGYHIIRVDEYVPLFAHPLPQIYGSVAYDAAMAKGDSLCLARADSVLHTLRTPAQAREAARRLHCQVNEYEHEIGGTERGPEEIQTFFRRLERLKPGSLYPGVLRLSGQGYAVCWVDSISPPGPAAWETARPRVLEAYRADAGGRRLAAKVAELDSLTHAGWSFDSVAVAWGGLERADDVTPGTRLPEIGVSARIDSVLFGAQGNDGLQPGQTSDWIRLPGGVTRLRILERRTPDPTAVTMREESERRMGAERGMATYFETLKKRYPVRILDRKLREIVVPEPPLPR